MGQKTNACPCTCAVYGSACVTGLVPPGLVPSFCWSVTILDPWAHSNPHKSHPWCNHGASTRRGSPRYHTIQFVTELTVKDTVPHACIEHLLITDLSPHGVISFSFFRFVCHAAFYACSSWHLFVFTQHPPIYHCDVSSTRMSAARFWWQRAWW